MLRDEFIHKRLGFRISDTFSLVDYNFIPLLSLNRFDVFRVNLEITITVKIPAAVTPPFSVRREPGNQGSPDRGRQAVRCAKNGQFYLCPALG